jgi:hypothetical protein
MPPANLSRNAEHETGGLGASTSRHDTLVSPPPSPRAWPFHRHRQVHNPTILARASYCFFSPRSRRESSCLTRAKRPEPRRRCALAAHWRAPAASASTAYVSTRLRPSHTMKAQRCRVSQNQLLWGPARPCAPIPLICARKPGPISSSQMRSKCTPSQTPSFPSRPSQAADALPIILPLRRRDCGMRSRLPRV